MLFEPIDLSVFPKEREEKLKEMYRYELFRPMFYRPNLWMHSKRVSWIVEDLLHEAMKYMDIDPEKARAMGIVHDDCELITGDLMSSTKAEMSLKEKEAFDVEEIQAGKDLAKKFNVKKFHGYSYEDLLIEMVQRSSPESQLVTYADKLDAYGETLHEIMAGNMAPMIFAIIHTSRNIHGLRFKHPHIMTFIKNTDHPFAHLDIHTPEDGRAYVEQSFFDERAHPHTEESLRSATDIFRWYDHWIKIMVSKGSESTDWLVNKVEPK